MRASSEATGLFALLFHDIGIDRRQCLDAAFAIVEAAAVDIERPAVEHDDRVDAALADIGLDAGEEGIAAQAVFRGGHIESGKADAGGMAHGIEIDLRPVELPKRFAGDGARVGIADQDGLAARRMRGEAGADRMLDIAFALVEQAGVHGRIMLCLLRQNVSGGLRQPKLQAVVAAADKADGDEQAGTDRRRRQDARRGGQHGDAGRCGRVFR